MATPLNVRLDSPAPARRRDELLGILIVAGGAILLAALVSFNPGDPSLFSSVADPSVRPRNWAGRLGASFADGAYQFFGFASLVVPMTLLVIGLRRFLGRPVGAWGTKGLGLVVTMLSLAPLAHLVGGKPDFFGGGLDAGGFAGDLLGRWLVSALNPPGASILLVATLAIGLLLATSFSLGDWLRTTWLKLGVSWRARSLERERAKEQERKEQLRREVVKKHLERAKQDAENPRVEPPEEPAAEVVYIPSIATLRVREKTGTGKFSVHKTTLPSRPESGKVIPVPAPFTRPAPTSAAERTPSSRSTSVLASQASPARVTPSGRAEIASSVDALAEHPLDGSFVPPALSHANEPFPTNARPASAPPAEKQARRIDPPKVGPAEPDLPEAVEVEEAAPAATVHAAPPRPIPVPPVSRPAQLTPNDAPQRILPFPSPKESQGWIFPPERLLRPAPKRDREKDREEYHQTMELITSKCLEFGVEGLVDTYTPGPVVTTYEFKPSAGVKVSKIAALENDLALALAAEKVRIERIPRRAAVGIEVPNRNRDLIALREVIESEKFKKSPSLLTIALGIDVQGEPIVADLARMPHLLVAGQTGAGKSVGVNGMITSILYKARPDEVKFIFVDPKMNDMKDYEDLPHLLVPVIVDPKKAANALKWAVDEMEGRYKLLSEWPGVRNIEQYNAAIKDPDAVAEVREKLGESKFRSLVKTVGEGETEQISISPMAYIVIVIDELADLMMTAPRDIEESVARLAQKARAVGIHLILATQRPSVDVITGTIKANLPCRVSFTTRTKIDSRTILDSMGAEALLGQGDMLFLAPGTSTLMRVHGGFIGGDETREICRFLKKQGKPLYDDSVTRDRDVASGDDGSARVSPDDTDPMYDQAARLVVKERMASISFLQRRLEIGFSRAGKLIDLMQRDGIVGPPAGGSKSRDVLVSPDYFEEMDRSKRGVE